MYVALNLKHECGGKMTRNNQVMVRMSDEERKMLQTLAENEYRSEAQMLRTLVKREFEKQFPVGGERMVSINAEVSTVAQ
jgi:hypothetical protein